MKEKGGQSSTGFSMADVFRSEVESHGTILTDGLVALRNNPDALDRVGAMIRAIHSIKGGAQIIESDAAVSIARLMEECFVSTRKGDLSLGRYEIDTLMAGVDMLKQISKAPGEEASEWIDRHGGRIDQILETLNGIVSPGTMATEVSADQKGPAQEAVTPPLPPLAEAISEEHVQSVSEARELVSDPTILDLFRTEVETHVVVLNDGLLALENDPTAKDQLEALMRAAHSIKGGARIVGLDAVVKLAHAMEDSFVAAQRGEVSLDSSQIDILLRAVDILIQLSKSLNQGETKSLFEGHDQIDRLVDSVSAIIGAKTAIPVSRVQPDALTIPARSLSASPSSGSVTTENLPVRQETDAVVPAQLARFDMDRTVKITATKIERLIGQAGEVVVNSRWLPNFSKALLELKRSHTELLSILDRLQETLARTGGDSFDSELVLKAREKTMECTINLADRLNQLGLFDSTSAALSDRLYHEVVSVKMRPFSDGVLGFPRMVRDMSRSLGKKVRLEIAGKSTEVDRDILEKLDAPLNHLLRNALDHGIETPEDRLVAGKSETGTLRLEAGHRSGMLMITIADDGRGIDLDALRQKVLQKGLANKDMIENMTEPELLDFLFLPGFSTSNNVTEISGRGVGLDIVRTMAHEVGGIVHAHSRHGEGLIFHLELPLTLSVVRTFLVEITGETYAFPIARIDRCLEPSKTDIETVEDRQYFRFDNTNIALVDIHDVLEIDTPPQNRDKWSVVVVSDTLNSYGLVVDGFLGESDLVVRPLDPRLGRVPDISSVAVMLDGSPVLVFDVEDLVRSIDNLLRGRRLRKLSKIDDQATAKPEKRVLVVDDSFTVREMERKLLEGRGYRVETAVDGMDGWNAVRSGRYDIVVSDVDMPRMNGIELITHIKQDPELKSIPIIIVSYKDREEDRLQGLEAGANYYLTKSSFEDDSLINATIDLIGKA